ncbi:MAG: hypothetical protein JO004_12100 [Methylobacteriaceae bacterium]|nr:hypothetical protein [Methylobacteriaceae bacterium]
MAKDLLLVGSVPLETAEEVMRMFGTPLGPYLDTMPDGEAGDRQWWVLRLSWQVFLGHPDLELLTRPKPDNGVERLRARDRTDLHTFRVKPGVNTVRFGDPGWRLGFTKDAIASYFVFKTLRKEGVLPKHLRFQVSIPLVNSVVSLSSFPNPEDLPRVRASYEEALAAEIAKMVEKIPQDDLAIQWDCSWEITDIYGGIPGFSKEGALERNIPQISRLTPTIPSDVMVGFHFCYGTFGGWPRFAPTDLTGAVDLANAAVAAAGRRVDWINIPILDRSDDAFFAPLARLKPQGSRVYLGMIHNMARFNDRYAAARKVLPDFGLSAPCGFGRSPRAALPGILEEHLEAMRLLGNTGEADTQAVA